MSVILIKLIPILILFVIGIIFKKIGIFKNEHGDLFLKIVFYLAAPAFIILSITEINLDKQLVYLPIISLIIVIITFVITFIFGKLLKLSKPIFGVFLIGPMIMNMGFMLPFIITVYGQEGLARASLFDFGNVLLTFTFVYLLACKFGDKVVDLKNTIKKLIFSPPVWALLIGIIFNLNGIRIPIFLKDSFQILGGLITPLIILSLGVYFTLKLNKIIPLVLAIIIRVVCGFLLGIILIKIFHLNGLNGLIVVLGSSAPIGYSTITFASLENLDKEFASNLVSFSILIGIIFTPILMILLK